VNLSVVLRWDSLLFFKGKNIGRTDGEEIFLKESKTTHFREVFNLIFYSNKGILVTLHPKNDVILGFSSIFTVSSNGGGQIIRGW
jgi:hypothetical protein